MAIIISTPGSREALLVDETTLPQRIADLEPGTYQVGRAAIDWMDGALTISAAAAAPYIITPMAFTAGSRMVGDVATLFLGVVGGDEPIQRDLVVSDSAGDLPAGMVTAIGPATYEIQTRHAGSLAARLALTGPGNLTGPEQTVSVAIALAPPEVTLAPPSAAPGAGVLLHWASDTATSVTVDIAGVGVLTGSGSPLAFDVPVASGSYSWSAVVTDGVNYSAPTTGILSVAAAGDWAFGSITTSGFEIVAAPPQPPMPMVSGITDTTASFAAGSEVGAPLELYMVQPAEDDELDATNLTIVTGRAASGYAADTNWRVRRLSAPQTFSTTGALDFLDNFFGTGQALSGSVSDSGHAWIAGTGTIKRSSSGWLVLTALPASAYLDVPDLADVHAELTFIARTTTTQGWKWYWRLSPDEQSYISLELVKNGTSVKAVLQQVVDGVATVFYTTGALVTYDSTVTNRCIDLTLDDDQVTFSYRPTAAGAPTITETYTTTLTAPGRVKATGSGTASSNDNAGIHINKLTMTEL